MSHDDLLRAGAVVAAAALLAAPYREQIFAVIAQAAEAARAHASTLGRVAAALLIVAAAWGKLPLPELGVVNVPAVVVPHPTPELQRLVAPVADALAGLPADKRAIWASTWAKAALVVEAEGTTTVAVFTDTPALRLFTTVALDVAWRRVAGNQPGALPGLREAVEAAMKTAMGLDAVPVTPELRARYAEVAKALAWAAQR